MYRFFLLLFFSSCIWHFSFAAWHLAFCFIARRFNAPGETWQNIVMIKPLHAHTTRLSVSLCIYSNADARRCGKYFRGSWLTLTKYLMARSLPMTVLLMIMVGACDAPGVYGSHTVFEMPSPILPIYTTIY